MTTLPSQKSSTSEFSMPDEGIHRMKLLRYDEPTLSQYKKPNGDDKWQVKMTFEIDDDESESDGEQINYFASLSMHPKSSMYPFVKAALGGAEIDPDEEIDLDDLLGKHFLGTVTHVEKPSRTTPGTMATFANVTGFAPIRRKKKAQPDATPQKPATPAPNAKDADGDDIWDDDETSAA